MQRKNKDQPVEFKWYRAKVTKKEWNGNYSKGTYTFLAEDGDKHVWIAFISVIPPEGCLPVTDIEELRMIDNHYRAINLYPRPFENVKNHV